MKTSGGKHGDGRTQCTSASSLICSGNDPKAWIKSYAVEIVDANGKSKKWDKATPKVVCALQNCHGYKFKATPESRRRRRIGFEVVSGGKTLSDTNLKKHPCSMAPIMSIAKGPYEATTQFMTGESATNAYKTSQQNVVLKESGTAVLCPDTAWRLIGESGKAKSCKSKWSSS